LDCFEFEIRTLWRRVCLGLVSLVCLGRTICAGVSLRSLFWTDLSLRLGLYGEGVCLGLVSVVCLGRTIGARVSLRLSYVHVRSCKITLLLMAHIA